MAGLTSFDGHGGYYAQQVILGTPAEATFMREFYRLLYAYYQQNGLYDFIDSNLQSARSSDAIVKPLRNPAWRVVEFYASKIWPGVMPDDMPIVTENDRIIEPIHLVWKMSNFSSMKSQWVRWMAIFGDVFLKVNVNEDSTQCWLEYILPEYVTNFEIDARGFLTMIRIDVPMDTDRDGEIDLYHTEYWLKETETVQVWEHDQGLDKELEELGSPTTQASFIDMTGDNFIPIAYQSFRNDGKGRASGAFVSQLDKIDEANKQATRLAQTLFRYNRALWAIQTDGVDAQGRPLPGVSVDSLTNSDSEFVIGDDLMLSLPPGSSLSTLVPPIDFNAALASLKAQLAELVSDLPELSYYELINQDREMSGRAINILLDAMISRTIEARGTADSVLIRANQMALTVGQNRGVFPRVGEWLNGDMEHKFKQGPILPRDLLEEAQVINFLAGSGVAIEPAAKFIGRNEQEATELAEVGAAFEGDIGGR